MLEKPVTPLRASAPSRLAWVEQIKAIALLWIFLNHTVEQLIDAPLLANPSARWPDFHQRLAQLLTPISGYGLLNLPINLVRYLGWFGDQGVQLFLIVSGFGLTWGLLARQGPSAIRSRKDFWLRRAERIYPLWWGFHILFAITYVLLGWGMSIARPAFWLSFVGLRVTTSTLYYFAPAWWYIGLLIQLYLVFPFLWDLLRRRGPLKLLTWALAVCLPVRAIGLLFFHQYLDAWSRGAVFVTRLPEFVLGMSLAAWMYAAPEPPDRRIRSASTIIASLLAYLVATFLSLTLLGMSVAPFLLGAAAFVVLYAALVRRNDVAEEKGTLVWLGRHSYSLYLLHHPVILLLLPFRPQHLHLVSVAAKVAAAMIVTLVGAIAMERVVESVQRRLSASYKRSGMLRPAVSVAVLLLVMASVLIGSELAVRRFAPQEVNGWGERPSLEPNDLFTYCLRPSRVTRLRWLTYDYTVTANSLGFPGPEYPTAKEPGVFRILTTGDAFTSAEGVDTNRAWPRLLEHDLQQLAPTRKIEVLNFGITGYGPNQYAAVIKHFAPIYHPDLIIIGFFVNDFQDVLRTDQEFRESIGFGRPSPDAPSSILRLLHLKRFLRARVFQPLVQRIRHQPSSEGLFLGNFSALEPSAPQYVDGPRLVAQRFQEIKQAAEAAHSRVVVAMFPASVQVCDPRQLPYYPSPVELNDKPRFDTDLPQSITQSLTDKAGFASYDLRPILKATPGGCPFMPHNMHWTDAGHKAVAGFLADVATHSVR